MTFPEADGRKMTALVIGVRHPSYVQDAADVPEFAALVAQELSAKKSPAKRL
jgi:hypothetical protein